MPVSRKRKKKRSRRIPAAQDRALKKRAGALCELCGAPGGMDRHHIEEFSKGGQHIPANLLQLCPSCHRQVPRYLSSEQQEALQAWHANLGTSGRLSALATLDAVEPSIDIGTVRFLHVRTVLRVRGQNVLAIHKTQAGIVMNVVMLEGFDPKLLVLSNKLVCADGYQIKMTKNQLDVSDHSGQTWWKVSGGQMLSVRGAIQMDGETLKFDDDGVRFRGLNLRFTNFECADTQLAAMDFSESGLDLNFGGAKIKVTSGALSHGGA